MEIKRCAFIVALAGLPFSSARINGNGSLDDLIVLAQGKLDSLKSQILALEQEQEQHRSLQVAGCGFSVNSGTCVLSGGLSVPSLSVTGTLTSTSNAEIGSLSVSTNTFQTNGLAVGGSMSATTMDGFGDGSLSVSGGLTIQGDSNFTDTIFSNYAGKTTIDSIFLTSSVTQSGLHSATIEQDVMVNDDTVSINGNSFDVQGSFYCGGETEIDNDLTFYSHVVINDLSLDNSMSVFGSVERADGDFECKTLFVDSCVGCDY